MTARIRLGVKGSSKGLWVSKPGYDVSSANAGDMLFASDAQAYQVIASGTMFIENCWAATASSGGTVSRSLALGIGAYSNVALWFDIVVTILLNTNAPTIPNDTYVRFIQETLDLRARISSGTLIFTGLNVPYYDQTQVQPRVDSNWFAFRSQYA